MDVLFLSASFGQAHDQVAEAVAEALRDAWPGCSHRRVDYLTLLHPVFRWTIRSAYFTALRRFPLAWAAFYRASDRPPQGAWQRRINRLGLVGLRRLLAASRPRVVVCTYPLQAGVLSDMRRRGEAVPRCAAVVTDHVVHGQWIHEHVDLYCVPSPAVASGLSARGVPAERLLATGLPLRAEFGGRPDREAARARLGLPAGEPHVLLMGGGEGLLASAPAICRRLLALPRPGCHLTVVCGRDETLRRRLEALARHVPRLHVRGFVTEVADLMAAADLLITKAGAITTAEALASGLPLVTFRPLPGQEAANASHLEREGAARWARSVDEVVRTAMRLLADPEERAAVAAAALRLARPQAAADVARAIRRLAQDTR